VQYIRCSTPSGLGCFCVISPGCAGGYSYSTPSGLYREKYDGLHLLFNPFGVGVFLYVLPPPAPGVIHIQPLRGCTFITNYILYAFRCITSDVQPAAADCVEKNILKNIIEVFWTGVVFDTELQNKMRINSIENILNYIRLYFP
jgi:hypothetical protein